jgi:hypothetical protein
MSNDIRMTSMLVRTGLGFQRKLLLCPISRAQRQKSKGQPVLRGTEVEIVLKNNEIKSPLRELVQAEAAHGDCA